MNMQVRFALRIARALVAVLGIAVSVVGCADIQKMHAEHMVHMAEMMGMSGHDHTTHAEVAKQITDARTRADHESLAKYYERQASAAEDKSAEYRHLAQAYGPHSDSERSPETPRPDPAADCDTLASLYGQVVAQDRALADIHRQLATEADE